MGLGQWSRRAGGERAVKIVRLDLSFRGARAKSIVAVRVLMDVFMKNKQILRFFDRDSNGFC
jgi:hypothetical protein